MGQTENGISPYEDTHSLPIGRSDSRSVRSPSSDCGQQLLKLSAQSVPPLALPWFSNGQPGINLVAQLSGKFFVPESPSIGPEISTFIPQELTCYRRNLFKVYGAVRLPPSLVSTVGGNGQTKPIKKLLLRLSAADTLDQSPVKIISVPARRNSSLNVRTLDTEPSTIAIKIASNNAQPDYTSIPFSWERLQFRKATAKHYRHAHQQQLYSVEVLVDAIVSDGSIVTLARASSTPIVVRGSTPRNFQVRSDGGFQHIRRRSSAATKDSALVSSKLSTAEVTEELSKSDPQYHTPNNPSSPLTSLEYNHTHQEQSNIGSEGVYSLGDPSNIDIPMDLDDYLQNIFENIDSDHEDEEDLALSFPMNKDATHNQTTETSVDDPNQKYEYYPLSIDDWTVPIEAIYVGKFENRVLREVLIIAETPFYTPARYPSRTPAKFRRKEIL